jgi:hypothetical protein
MIQNWIHRLEEGNGLRYLKYFLVILGLIALILDYNFRAYVNFSNAEAMDSAQLARNLAEHKGYRTLFVRPFSLYLLQKAGNGTNAIVPTGDARSGEQIAEVTHPDLANPPVYPFLLSRLMMTFPQFKYQAAGSSKIWNRQGQFWIYRPDFLIGVFNQILFLAGGLAVFFFARRLFDPVVAWTAAALFLGTDLFWRFSMSGISTMLLILIFLALAWGLVILEESVREGKRSLMALLFLTAGIGIIVGVGCLTRYSFGWLILPVLIFLILFAGKQRVLLCLTALAAFSLVVGPWVARNYHLSHAPFGVAGYAMYENTSYFPDHRLQRSLKPDLSQVQYNQVWYKFIRNFKTCVQEDLPRLGGNWVSAFFLVGLLVHFKNQSSGRLRYFLLLCLPFLMGAQSIGKTSLSDDSPVINSENLVVLIAPLILIFGIQSFYVALNRRYFPVPQVRYLIIGAFCALLGLPTIINFISPRVNALAYPPYHPVRLQRTANWMRPDELMMSDVPWAVAWYGRRECIWLTLDAQDAFNDVYHYEKKPVSAVYLTQLTTDARFLTQWIGANENSWGSFAIESMSKGEVPPAFPLRKAPAGFLPDQLFITDVDRWTQHTAPVPAH